MPADFLSGQMLWVTLALAAAVFQTARNALAKSLANEISPALNSWSRFAFNLPFSLALVSVLVVRAGEWPTLPPLFLFYCLLTGVCQLLGNVALVAAFRRANFARAIVLHKLEVVFTALAGALFFAEDPTAVGWVGVVACAGGVLVMNLGSETGPAGWRRMFRLDRGALLALACALLLVMASFMLKEGVAVYAAANARVGAGRFEAAAETLFHTTWIEVVILTATILLFQPREMLRVRDHWRRMALIGATGFSGSLGWFWAYSLTLVAYVKAVGQVEAILAVALAILLWRERAVWRQLPGIAIVVAGIALVLLG